MSIFSEIGIPALDGVLDEGERLGFRLLGEDRRQFPAPHCGTEVVATRLTFGGEPSAASVAKAHAWADRLEASRGWDVRFDPLPVGRPPPRG